MNTFKHSLFILSVLLAQTGFAVAQTPTKTVADNPMAVQGPIDIQAAEQEFSGDQIIAKGNVRVKYKESVIIGPEATLIKDASGSPKTAVFTGHPHLTQTGTIMDADQLTFQIADQQVLAEGNAHSEVQSSSDGAKKSEPGETIITDSDRQEYNKLTDKFEALGHVRVKHGEIRVLANKLSLVYGLDKKPETAVFTGHVAATQGQNKTWADVITYTLSTRRLQASGHVKSQVIQKADADTGKGEISRFGSGLDQMGRRAQAGAVQAAETKVNDSLEHDEKIIIFSDAQDYTKERGHLSADGNVRVYYQDTVGLGPKAIMIRNPEGRTEKVIFTGRSQITQPGRRWIADRIIMRVTDNKVLAEGNSKAFILKTEPTENKKLVEPSDEDDDSLLAGRKNSISSARTQATQ